MPLYFFDLYDDEVTRDAEGVELPDVSAARLRAFDEARALASATVRSGEFSGHHRIEILDQDRALVGTVRFDEAVKFTPGPTRS